MKWRPCDYSAHAIGVQDASGQQQLSPHHCTHSCETLVHKIGFAGNSHGVQGQQDLVFLPTKIHQIKQQPYGKCKEFKTVIKISKEYKKV